MNFLEGVALRLEVILCLRNNVWKYPFFWGNNMIVIVCLDDKNGMMFNHRRQSRDQAVTERIQKICKGKIVWMNSYSEKLYGSLEGAKAVVADDFLSLASGEKIEKMIIFGWNRTYPADVYLDLDLSHWERKGRDEFHGSSHERMTEEIYERRI